jgi:SAM-dependent methyltransferase
MEQAFHHIEPRQEAAKKIASLLKPGGKLIISESNALNPLIQAVLFKQRGFQTIKTATDRHGRSVPYGNERILSARTLARTFAEVGIECESVRYFRAFPSHPIFEKLFWLEKRLPQWMVPLFTHYNYVGIKR